MLTNGSRWDTFSPPQWTTFSAPLTGLTPLVSENGKDGYEDANEQGTTWKPNGEGADEV